MTDGLATDVLSKQDVPDYLRTGLKLVIVGINPGMRSGQSGHHYAFRGNHFWPLLYDAGLLPEPLTYAEDHRVMEYDIGLTNLVHRTSRSADELSKAELQAGAENLRAKLLMHRPRVVCFNGMGIYEAFSGRRKVAPGLQEERLEEMLMFVVPSSSGRTAAYLRPAKLALFQELRALVERVASEAASR
ncbi:MAG TPA: mismatch-specific DNA-glycosylase [Dehalococcoidia bacterium]|nr:mismatch-specific DNA-glycosylase [Dehalococcoidia bacterium]